MQLMPVHLMTSRTYLAHHELDSIVIAIIIIIS